MVISSSLNGILYTFSASLLYPVIIVLLGLTAHSLILIGEFLSEYARRHRDVRNLETCCLDVREQVGKGAFTKAADSLRDLRQNFMVTAFAKSAADHVEKSTMASIEWLSQEYEIMMAKRLEQTRIIATIAPMLGLMGTLIPLGPALIGLSQGNIEQLANNLMIAFATTVVGLFAGTIGYVLTQVRKRWYWQDMADIDYILDTLEVQA